MIEKVIEILSEFTTLEKETIERESGLITDLGLNSLDIINAVVTFEEAFDIEIPDGKIAELHTVGDVVDYLETMVQ